MLARFFYRGAQAGAQTAACGEAALPQQEKFTRQMSPKKQLHLHKSKVPL
jgi:hypothetical protein